jgi:hypothetical protein
LQPTQDATEYEGQQIKYNDANSQFRHSSPF